MRKIVIPIDFSEIAKKAFAYALDLLNEPAIFYVIHTYEPELLPLDKSSNSETAKKPLNPKFTSQINALIDDLQSKYPANEHQFHAISSCGILVECVNNLVNEHNIDLVVMGTRGMTNDKNITFGSYTLQVLKQVCCPVLCIPENYTYQTPKSILFPTNYMIPYQKRELKLLDEICQYYQSKVHVLYVSPFDLISKRQKNNQLFLKNVLEKHQIIFHQKDQQGKTNLFNQMIDELHIDLLVMVNSRHSFLETQLEKSTVDKLSLQPKIPFLILQNFIRK